MIAAVGRLLVLGMAFATAAPGCGGSPRATRSSGDPPAIAPARVVTAIRLSIRLLQTSGETWLRKEGCSSCHHQALGAMAIGLAKERGLPIDDALFERQRARILSEFKDEEKSVLAGGGLVTLIRSFRLVGLAAIGTPPDEATAAAAYFVARRQDREGSWRATWNRPPIEGGRFSGAAVGLRALQAYAVSGEAAVAERVQHASAWLRSASPATTDDRAWQILGMAWAGAPAAQLGGPRAALLAEQHDDGGWGQIPGAESDAYATGQALVALHLGGGLPVTDAAYQRGVAFLLATQLTDGSWHVRTRRRIRGLPTFETGFPHGPDQFISFAASTNATMALTLTIHPERPTALMATPRRPLAPAAGDSLLAVVSFGTLSDVQRLLDAGADANAADEDGTALMRAVDDEAKVRLLLARGAHVNARTRGGGTALLAAAAGNGPPQVLRLLIDAGADVKAVDEDGRSALIYASSYAADVARVSLLLAAGAPPNPDKAVATRALAQACRARDLEATRILLAGGADIEGHDLDINDGEEGQMSALAYATVAGFPEVVELLLDRGAAPDGRDLEGRTPLMWAASVDTDPDGRIAALLIAHGADVNARAPGEVTPLSLARREGQSNLTRLLIAHGARE